MVRRVGLVFVALLTLLLADVGRRRDPSTAEQVAVTSARIAAQLAKSPLRFEENVGQMDARVRYVARRGGVALFLTDAGATLALQAPTPSTEAGRSRGRVVGEPAGPDTVLTLKVAGARVVAPRGDAELETKSNYFIGNDPNAWRTNVVNYARVVYPSVLDGVDLVYHGEDGQLEYDFVVAPGADPSSIALEVEGGEGFTLTPAGDLAIHTPHGDLVQPRPRVYQHDAAGVTRDVAASYRLAADGRVAFDVAAYDRRRPLVIDPLLVYSSYLGGTNDDSPTALAVDASGNAYVAGRSQSADFPLKNSAQGSLGSAIDAFVTKIAANGTIAYSTYLGGNSLDQSGGVAVDASGNAYVAGSTGSTNFPTTAGAYRTTNAGRNDTFVTKLAANGTIAYSTYLGGAGDEDPWAIAVDASGNAHVVGSTDSTAFPTTTGAFKTSYGGGDDGFVTKLNANGTGLLYSTYLGGGGLDLAASIAVDSSGSAYVIGNTDSSDFPTTNGAYRQTPAGSDDVFIAKLSPNGTALTYSTYVGGSGSDRPYGLAVDASGNAYVTGTTASTNYPTTSGAYKRATGGGSDAFVTKVNPNGTGLVYSTYLGGSGDETAYNMAVDSSGIAYVVGSTTSTNFPTAAPHQGANGGGNDAFLSQLDAAGSALVFSTYLGGSDDDYGSAIALDSSRTIYFVGATESSNFPTKGGAFQGALGGGRDTFFARFTNPPPLAISPSSASIVPKGSQTFGASGGTAPYTFSLQTNASGGSINASTGAYVAGPTGDKVDVVKVTDAANASVTATVNVGPGITLNAAKSNVAPSETLSISATGGSGSYTSWQIVPNASGASITSSGTPATYKAGTTGSTTDTVKVTDSLGNTATINIAVGAAVAINGPANVAPRQAATFTATGGSGSGFTFAFVTNSSGGTISAAGAYKAGATPNATDTVKVTDSLGNSATTTVKVGAALAIAPSTTTSPPRGTIGFSVSGGTAIVTSWSVVTNGSGATIDATGSYKAGSNGGTTDTVQATDSVGNTATATVTVTAGVSITPPSPSTAPRGTIDLHASGGSGKGFTFAFVTNASGATLDASTGAYKAGATGSTTDKIEVTDSLGNKAQVTITVGPGVTIAPASPTTPPRGAVNLTATGGAGGPYTWTIPTNASGASIDGAGHYTAGATGAVVDVVQATDALGNTASVNVSVGGGLAVAPAAPKPAPKGSVSFSATGGGSGRSWSIVTNHSGATIDASTGAYTAGSTPNVTDTVQVTDSLANKATVDVLVGPGVTITPSPATVAPLGAIAFGAAGGSGTGYAWSLSSNHSGATIVDGSYTAGPTGSGTDVVTVTDSLGNTASVDVTVTAALALSPLTASVPPKGTHTFTASGGSGGYTFALSTNASGGNIASTGTYTAGATASVGDVVKVTDSNGATATATVDVGAGVTIAPANPAATPNGKITFTATGGSGSGFTWSVLVDASSGATIDATTGAYKAGPVPQTTDIVQVSDALGNTASVSISVGAGLAASPTSPTAPPRGTITFAPSGGGGSYTWSFVTNASSGTLSSAGVYKAGATGNVTDIVRLEDQDGNALTIDVHVGPGVSVSPSTATVVARATQALVVSGGSGTGYVWSLSTNLSGATIAPDGTYTAGAQGAVADVVTVTDSLGNTASATLDVRAADAPPPPPPPPAPSGTSPTSPGANTIEGGGASVGCGCVTTGSSRGVHHAAIAAIVLALATLRRRRSKAPFTARWARRG